MEETIGWNLGGELVSKSLCVLGDPEILVGEEPVGYIFSYIVETFIILQCSQESCNLDSRLMVTSSDSSLNFKILIEFS